MWNKGYWKKKLPLGGLPQRNVLKSTPHVLSTLFFFIHSPNVHSRRWTFNLTWRNSPFNKHLISEKTYTIWSILIGLHHIINSARNKWSYLFTKGIKNKQTSFSFICRNKSTFSTSSLSLIHKETSCEREKNVTMGRELRCCLRRVLETELRWIKMLLKACCLRRVLETETTSVQHFFTYSFSQRFKMQKFKLLSDLLSPLAKPTFKVCGLEKFPKEGEINLFRYS